MVDLQEEADRHAAMIRPHVEATGGVEPFFTVNRPGVPPLAIPASFETVEEKEDGLELLRATFQELGCTHVTWISEAWVAVSGPGGSDVSPRDRPDRTDALMIVVEDASGAQVVQIVPFSKGEGGVRWGEPIENPQAQRRLLSGPVEPELRERARLLARQYQPPEEQSGAPAGRSLLGRMTAWMSGRSLAVVASLACGWGVLLHGEFVLAQQPPVPSAPGAPAGHPAEDYRRASEAFRGGRREEATYLFYRGQYRFRVHLKARPDLRPDGDPALFASLNEVLGRPINEWAFGDVPALAAVIERVLAWQAANDDPFTPKASFPTAHEEIRSGLADLRAQIMAERAAIKAQRQANGLPNRG